MRYSLFINLGCQAGITLGKYGRSRLRCICKTWLVFAAVLKSAAFADFSPIFITAGHNSRCRHKKKCSKKGNDQKSCSFFHNIFLSASYGIFLHSTAHTGFKHTKTGKVSEFFNCFIQWRLQQDMRNSSYWNHPTNHPFWQIRH
jgi:hypothetical protein